MHPRRQYCCILLRQKKSGNNYLYSMMISLPFATGLRRCSARIFPPSLPPRCLPHPPHSRSARRSRASSLHSPARLPLRPPIACAPLAPPSPSPSPAGHAAALACAQLALHPSRGLHPLTPSLASRCVLLPLLCRRLGGGGGARLDQASGGAGGGCGAGAGGAGAGPDSDNPGPFHPSSC